MIARIQRRSFLTLLGSAAAWPLAARGQRQAMPVIGYLRGAVTEVDETAMIAFRAGLGEMGYGEGRNVHIEYRVTDQNALLPLLAAELVERKVAAIFAGSLTAAAAAKAATTSIPIVFTGAGDPVRIGLVNSLNRPGGNVTGMT